MKNVRLFVTLLSLFLYAGPAISDQEQGTAAADKEKASVEDVIPLTVGNLRGHKMLYHEGWRVITSTSKALDYAKERSLVSSRAALRQAVEEASHDTAAYKESISADVKASADLGRNTVRKGTERTGKILGETHSLANVELLYARKNFKKAMSSFVQGNLSIAKRTEEDRRELANLPGNYFKTLAGDFSNILELADSARKRFAEKIDPQWEQSFKKASREFRGEYEKSGTKQNTLIALGPILAGYLKSFYYGLAAPASKSIVKTGVVGTSYVVFLPVTTTAVVAGRTVQSVGLTVYYAGKTGVNIVSSTVEGGLLSGLSLLSLSSVPVTYAAGATWGAMNQVAFSTVGPAAGAVEAAATTTVHTAGYVGFVTYDAVKGATKIVINQAASGIVLGYNALTALPVHALMGVEDAAVFLFWDGPRLAVAVARGRIGTNKHRETAAEATGDTPDIEPGEADKSSVPEETYSLGDLPVGTVVDLKKLENTDGVDVEILSTDNAVIKEVLEKIPDDVRVTNDDGE